MDTGVRNTVKFRTVSFALTFGIVACGGLSLAAQKKSTPTSGPVVFAQDKGKLTIKLGGQTVGHEEFEIAPSGGGWLAKGTAEIKPPEGASSKVSGSLTLQGNGAPISYDWSAQTEKTNGAHVLFANGVASITLEMQGARPFQQDLSFGSPMIAVLDNNLYHQYAVLARIYDWSKGGVQTFPVIIPQELTPGSITVQSTGSASAEGKTFTGRGDKLFAWLDKDAQTETLLTTERQLSLQKENVQLLGLDHPLVANLLKKFRELPPEEIGLCLKSSDGTEGIFAAWAVDARGDKGQIKRMIVTLGVDWEGKRHVAWERQPETFWRSQAASHTGKQADEKLAMLRSIFEPMLQRELEHRGVGTRGFESKLIAWVEAVN